MCNKKQIVRLPVYASSNKIFIV